MENIYADIAARTGGNIYIGVVGPVRTGKSTLIKRIMELLVIPAIEDPYRRERAKDELPQSGSGKTIMTSEPKFVPEEAVEISPDDTTKLRVRMIDSVGYMVPGATGAMEDGQPRMVTTPWCDQEIPMTEAAELGTKKVMQEHCSIGLVVTTDGTVTDIPREDYVEAEGRAITDMQATGKPFIVIINSRNPKGEAATQVAEHIKTRYNTEPLITDCQSMDIDEIRKMLTSILYAFPLGQIEVYLPRWIQALEQSNPIKKNLYEDLLRQANQITCLRQAAPALEELGNIPQVKDVTVGNIDLSTGTVRCTILFPETMFYDILSQRAGIPVPDEAALIKLLEEYRAFSEKYKKLSSALDEVEATGYGIVMPSAQDMTMYPPETVKKGGSSGIKLRSTAPSIHMIRVDMDTQICPMVGTEQQSAELAQQLAEQTPEDVWQYNIFGKTVGQMLQDGMNSKLTSTPEVVRAKFRGTLTRIVNEGATGLVCLIL